MSIGSQWAKDRGYPLLLVYVRPGLSKTGTTVGYGYRVLHFVASNGKESVAVTTTGDRCTVLNKDMVVSKVLNGTVSIADNGHILFRKEEENPWQDWGPFERFDSTMNLRSYTTSTSLSIGKPSMSNMEKELAAVEDEDVFECPLDVDEHDLYIEFEGEE